MAGSVQASPGYQLEPSAVKATLPTNYITNFDFLNQYLPDTYEAEFERYGNRSIASFLRMVGAELPSNSDLIKWAEQGRLHTKYVNCTSAAAVGADTATWTVNDANVIVNFRVNQTVFLSANAGSASDRAVITAVDTVANTFTVAYYAASGQAIAVDTPSTAFVYGSEFTKGSLGMEGSLESQDIFFENKPIIIKDKYTVSGSDMAQIGWVEVTSENGATGYLWYIKSEHETRLRFEDYLEMSVIEGELVSGGSTLGSNNIKGTQGLFSAVKERGNVVNNFTAAAGLSDFDSILKNLDTQGAIEENMFFLNRATSLDFDDMLASLSAGAAGGVAYGLFENSEQMALNLGFSGFRRGSYDFYKTDWKYLNDASTRGGMANTSIDGVLVPAGTSTVYDQQLGTNIRRPFLHVRYRANQADDRRMKNWITGSVGGAYTSDLDAMQVHFLSERCLVTQAANNFVLFTSSVA